MKKNRKKRLLGCSLVHVLNAKRDVEEARREARKERRGHKEAFIEASLWRRREKIRTLENGYYHGLIETLVFHVMRAKTMDELERAKAEYNTFRVERARELHKEVRKLMKVSLYLDGKTETYWVF